MINTLFISLLHLAVTLPGLLYFTCIAFYYRFIRDTPQFPFDPKKDTVVFIHGRGGSPNDMIYLATFDPFLSDKYNIILASLPNTRSTSIETDSDNLHTQLEHVNTKIILIGLSKGGLIAAHYTTRNKQVIKLITISSPLEGTCVADLSPTHIVKTELSHNNTLVNRISNDIANSKCATFHIVPVWDHVIIPQDSAYYKHTPQDNIFHYDGYCSHMGIQLQSKCANKIIDWIRS